MQSLPQHTAPGNSPSWAELPPRIRERLERDGINSAADWRRLGRRRHELFGIVPRVVEQLDDLARGAR